MKKILIAGLLTVSSTGALFTAPVFAADDDNRTERRDNRRDDNNRPPRPDHDGDHDRDNDDRDHRDGDRDRNRDNNDRDHGRDNNRPDWNGPRPGNGVPPRNGGYVPPRPLPGNGNGYGRPGNGYGRPGNSRPGNGYGYGRPGNGNYGGGYNGGYGGNYGGYNGGNYGGGYNGYGNQNLENIAKRIELALRNDRQLSRYKLGTDTVRGTIELEGSVRSNSERQRAISIARDIARGVQINGSRLLVRY